MKAIKANIAGKDYYLAFTGGAMYDLSDLTGDALITTLTQPNTREALDYLCKAVSILIEHGELARRHMGYDYGSFLTDEEVKALIQPSDILQLKMDLANAIFLGYGREIEAEEKEVDLVLQDLEKKTKKS